MKKYLFMFSIIFVFSSCIKDENNIQSFTKADADKCFLLTRGDYSGYLVYPAQNPDKAIDQADTIAISWNVSADTMLVVNQFPGKVIAESITRNNELKAKMIEQNPIQKLSCYMAFYEIDPTIMFILGPQKMEFPVFYDGATHTVKAYFWSDTISEVLSYGAKNASNNEMVVRIMLAAVYLDDNENSNLLGSLTNIMIPIYLTTSF